MNNRLLLPDPFFIDFKVFHDVGSIFGKWWDCLKESRFRVLSFPLF